MSNNRHKIITKTTLVGLVVNLLLAILKTIFGFIGHSYALLVDGIHSFSDLLSDVLILYASKHSKEEPDDEHPYGHGRFETIATLGLSLALIFVGFSFIWNIIADFNTQTQYLYSNWIVFIVILSILSKEALYWYTLLAANKINSQMLKANAWHHRSDALSSIIVLIGIIFTLLNFKYLDSIAAIIVGFMITYIGYKLGKESIEELVDTGLDPETINKLKQEIIKIDGVESIHLFRTRKHANHIVADVHIQVYPYLSVSEGHMIAVNVEKYIKQSQNNFNDIVVHIDPEDDEKVVYCAQLPTRKEILSSVERYFKNNNCFEYNNIVLHYLSGSIDIDFYLSLDCLEKSTANEIKNNIKKALQNLDYINNIKVYFS